MIVRSASSVYEPISISLDERDALRRYLVDLALPHWFDVGLPHWNLPGPEMGWHDALCLVDVLERDKALEGTVKLTLSQEALRRTFTRIKEDLVEIESCDPEQKLIVAGICERVLGAGSKVR